jgi:hypothetical protein
VAAWRGDQVKVKVKVKVEVKAKARPTAQGPLAKIAL